MSLINQMLKDLESRRTPENPAHTLLQGHSAENAGARNRKLLLMLSLLVALLALILAYLVWDRITVPSDVSKTDRGAMASEPPAAPAQKMAAPTKAAPEATPPVATAMPAQTQPQLLDIEPQELTGSWEKQRISLNGRNLGRDSRVIVAWGDNEKILPPERVLWRDSNTLEVEIITGTQASEWSVALVGSQDKPLHFQVVAPTRVDPVPQTKVTVTPDKDEGSEPAIAIEKHIRPLRPEQLAEKAYQEGYQLLQRGNQSGAEKKWREAIDHDPRYIASREGLAGLYLSQGRNVEAGEVLAKGLDFHPGYGQFALLYARLQLENGQPDVALATLERALESETQNADFFAFLAALYQRQKAYDKSVAAYQRALRLQPKQGVWWMGIGISLEGEGKQQEALTAYNEAKQSGNLPAKLLQYVEGRLRALDAR